MQYKNLSSLGRAYRAGDVDRSTYIKQRRDIIDDFTSTEPEDDEDITVIKSEDGIDEATTIISNATELSSPDTPSESFSKSLTSRFIKLMPFIVIATLVIFGAIFYASTL